MIDAYMLVDFNNPLSLQYMNLSLESFSAVDDIVKITPVQCTTPETLPIRFQKNEEPLPPYIDRNNPNDVLRPRYFGGSFCDTGTYQAIMYSQYQLIQRIANGEPIAIMEHDAALVNEDSFREMVDLFWAQVDVFIPGACLEFFGLSQKYAKWMVDVLDNFPTFGKPNSHHNRLSGAYGIISSCMNKEKFDFDMSCNFLLPTKRSNLDKICLSFIPRNSEYGIGHLFDPACKQFLFDTLENTNEMVYDLNAKNHDHDVGVDANTVSGYYWSRDFVVVEKPKEI